MTLQQICQSIRECNACSLKQNTLVSGFHENGNFNSKIIIVGEALGKEEAKNGLPFQGKCGKLLDKMLHSIGIDRNSIFIGNLVNCRPVKDDTDSDRPPTKEEIAFCKHFIEEIIDEIKPELIITLGGVSFKSLTGNDNIPVGESLKGEHPNRFSYKCVPLWPMYHPSYILRDYHSGILNYWESWLKIRKYLEVNKIV